MFIKLNLLPSLQKKAASLCFLNCWNTWGFPGSRSGFSSLQMVEKMEIVTQTPSGRWDFATQLLILQVPLCMVLYAHKSIIRIWLQGSKSHPQSMTCLLLPVPAAKLCSANLHAENGWCRKQSKVFGRKWMIENKSLFVLNDNSFFRVPWFGSLPTHWYSPRMQCALLCGMGECRMVWSGMGYDGASVGVDFLIQERWMLFVLLPLMAAALYCLPLWQGNLWCPARCPVVGCHITC